VAGEEDVVAEVVVLDDVVELIVDGELDVVIAVVVLWVYSEVTTTVQGRPESHLGLRSQLDLAPKRLESRLTGLSHHLMTRPDLKFS